MNENIVPKTNKKKDKIICLCIDLSFYTQVLILRVKKGQKEKMTKGGKKEERKEKKEKEKTTHVYSPGAWPGGLC